MPGVRDLAGGSFCRTAGRGAFEIAPLQGKIARGPGFSLLILSLHHLSPILVILHCKPAPFGQLALWDLRGGGARHLRACLEAEPEMGILQQVRERAPESGQGRKALCDDGGPR